MCSGDLNVICICDIPGVCDREGNTKLAFDIRELKSVMPVCPQFLNVVKAVKVLSGAKPNDFPFTIVVRSTSPLLSLFGLKMKFSMLMKRAFGNAFLRFALESLSILIVS